MADANMQCPCGYRTFRENVTTQVSTVSRWAMVSAESETVGGPVGSPSPGTWGRFDISVTQAVRRITCTSCRRVRSTTVLGGAGVLGSRVLGTNLYIWVTDSAQLSCLRVRFTSSAGVFERSPTRYVGTSFPLLSGVPDAVEDEVAAGGVLAGVIYVPLPEVDYDHDVVVSLVDICAGVEAALDTLLLESVMQVHSPREAELNGFPVQLLDSGLAATFPTAQPGSGSLMGIPFDRCIAVMEYDARLGTLPVAQGWTHDGSGAGVAGDYTLEAGGVLHADTTDPSFWEKEITLGSAADHLHAYMRCRVTGSDAGVGEGLELRADVTPGGLSDYYGVRFYQNTSNLCRHTLVGGTQSALATRNAGAWTSLFTAYQRTPTAVGCYLLEGDPVWVAGTTWGSEAGGGANATVRARFGDVIGSTLVADIRNVVVSTPGRFVRAFFRSYAAVAAPVLRLYFMSDLGSLNGARIKVSYGALGLGSDPYAAGTSTSTTAYFTVKNSMVEVPVTLSGLTAMAPFWFSVERDWAHVEDVTTATIHLLSATVRSA